MEEIDSILDESALNKEKENVSEDSEDLFQESDDGLNESTLLNNITNNSHLFTSEDLLENSSWELNELAWARMSTYPFWPCMVTCDPNSLMTFQKIQTIGKSKTLMIHVHFFNDNGKHSWIPAHHMIPFNGIEDFRKRASLVTNEIRKKEPKFAAALIIKPSIFKTWQKAVAEAMDVLYELDMTALENFKPQLKDLTNNITKNVERKRKRKSDEEGKKYIKNKLSRSLNNNESKLSSSTNSVENNLNLETPPVSPPNEDDLRTATFQKQKRITKMINKLQPPDFEVYYERNFLNIKEQHSDTTDEQVREYLYDVWEHMGPEEKLKYRAVYKTESNS